MHRVKKEDTIIRSDKVKKNRYVKECVQEGRYNHMVKQSKEEHVREGAIYIMGTKIPPFPNLGLKEECMIGVSAFGVPRHRRNTMAAALIAVRHNRKKSAHLGEPEVNLCEKVPTVDECIKVGNVERLTHR